MMSRWFEYKEQAINLRRQGLSIREIEITLGIPRSTLSAWLKGIALTFEQRNRLQQNADMALVKARAKAKLWHKEEKLLRLQKAQEDAKSVLKQIDINDNLVELVLAMLYQRKGVKASTAAIGNSNPLILRFFLKVLTEKYKLNPEKIRFDLHIRADQDPLAIKKHWAKELNVPITYFKHVVADNRTPSKASYSNYKGVCIINCGDIAIQRKLIYLYNLFCQRVIDEWTVSSTG